MTAAFHPDKIDASVLTLNVLLGVGTALAPVLVAIFVGLGFWWGLAVLSALLLASAAPSDPPGFAERGRLRRVPSLSTPGPCPS